MKSEEVGQRSNCNTGEDETPNEEQKMEEFFMLIRRLHEARNQRRRELSLIEEENNNNNNNNNDDNNKLKKKMRRLNDEGKSSWVPSFERDDFTKEIEFRRLPLIFPSPCNNKLDVNDNNSIGKQEEKGNGLDLKLTL